MQEELQKELEEFLNNRCYTIYFDTSKVNLAKLVGEVAKIGDVVFNEGKLVVFLHYEYDKNDLLLLINSQSIEEYFCERVVFSETEDFLRIWMAEHIKTIQRFYIEDHMQDTLKKANDNLLRVIGYIDKKIKV